MIAPLRRWFWVIAVAALLWSPVLIPEAIDRALDSPAFAREWLTVFVR